MYLYNNLTAKQLLPFAEKIEKVRVFNNCIQVTYWCNGGRCSTFLSKKSFTQKLLNEALEEELAGAAEWHMVRVGQIDQNLFRANIRAEGRNLGQIGYDLCEWWCCWGESKIRVKNADEAILRLKKLALPCSIEEARLSLGV
jgi:hypothetical protein